MVIIRPIVLRMNRKTGIALIAALIVALQSVVVCAAGVPNCSQSSVSGRDHQEQGCHEHQRHEPRESQRCVCCDSVLCAPRGELTRPADPSGDRVCAFAPLCIAALNLNPDIRESLPRASGLPPRSSVPVFLVQKTLLI